MKLTPDVSDPEEISSLIIVTVDLDTDRFKNKSRNPIKSYDCGKHSTSITPFDKVVEVIFKLSINNSPVV